MGYLIRAIIGFIGIGVVAWLASFGVDGLRATPSEPKSLAWSSDLDVRYADLDGVKVRYLKTGEGPNLVLFHTLRTQLDIFNKMIPELRSKFTVYAVDYPGHGWSDIPEVDYDPNQFYEWAEKFLDKIDVQNATIAGISIGGTIVLELAARKNPQVAKVISINPYDYQSSYSAGLKGSSTVAKIVVTAAQIPFIGESVMRMRNTDAERQILEGGVADPSSLSDWLFTEMVKSGSRPGHYQAFINLLRHEDLWQEARSNYPKINLPVLLIYGDQDWAPAEDQARTRDLIPNVRMDVVKDGGHFLTLDQPKALTQLIIDFAAKP